MTVADPGEIGCRYCGAAAGLPCMSGRARTRRQPHAIRWADSQLDEAEPGWAPVEPTAVVIDFVEARMRKIARDNGVAL